MPGPVHESRQGLAPPVRPHIPRAMLGLVHAHVDRQVAGNMAGPASEAPALYAGALASLLP
eukprot:3676382-Pyramimonas_sp.AAC.1